MTPIPVMVNGLPGNAAAIVARHFENDSRFLLVPFSLTGPGIPATTHAIGASAIALVLPEEREERIHHLINAHGPFISVDFTLPSAISGNTDFYCRHKLPFVMGTTGGDREQLTRRVLSSDTCAVIAPNMAKQIVGFQAMMAYASETFPGLFKDYRLSIRESHQASKMDTSGTAKAMVGYFNRLGVAFTEDDIIKIRDPKTQKTELGVPEAYLSGHAWHTYTLASPDGTAMFSFTHNVNGRDIYAWGTLDAVGFLQKKVEAGEKGRVFSMMDVLKAGGL